MAVSAYHWTGHSALLKQPVLAWKWLCLEHGAFPHHQGTYRIFHTSNRWFDIELYANRRRQNMEHRRNGRNALIFSRSSHVTTIFKRPIQPRCTNCQNIINQIKKCKSLFLFSLNLSTRFLCFCNILEYLLYHLSCPSFVRIS